MPSNNTDTRVVQMQFDNKEFDKNIAKSEKSLERFKEALDFEECEKSLEDFGDATRKLTFDQMAANLQKLTDKFTGLGTVSEYVISQVRHGLESAAAQAKAFFNSMTIDQVNSGFEKFGLLNKNVQTIMAATGRSEEDVYKVMKRLNQYTDQTSYSFIDMAANIGKFTSVGIKLEDAEKQMEGIANWAARSGGGINEASRAMYNLSQAMGVGALTKIDWKSIENAGMATKEFKEQLIQAGLAAGQLVKQNGRVMTAKSLGKQVEVTYQNLAETLSKKWADTEVMQKAFMAYYYEDLYYSGEITNSIKTNEKQKNELKKIFDQNAKIDLKDTAKVAEKADEARKQIVKATDAQIKLKEEIRKTNGQLVERKDLIPSSSDSSDGLSLTKNGISKSAKEAVKARKEVSKVDKTAYVDSKTWLSLGIDSDDARQKVLDAAVEQKKLLREVNDEGYTVYKTLQKGAKQVEITKKNFEKEFLDKGLLDESLATVVFGFDLDPMIETTKKQKEAINNALGSDEVILKKDWVEDMTAAGLATNEFKQAVLDAAVAEKTLKKEVDKKTGKTIYKTLKGATVDLKNFEDALKDKFFTKAVAERVAGTSNLAKAAYEAAQKCMTFTDVLNAWKDQLSTGWMNSYNLIFGELSESMELFSNICNKVGEALDNLLSYRNKLLEAWGNGGGRNNLWSLIVGEVTDEGEVIAYEGAYGFLDALMDIGNLIKEGFWNMMKLFAPDEALALWDNEDARTGWFASSLDRIVTNVRNFITSIHDFFNASAEGSQKSRWQQIQDVVNAIYAAFVLAYTVIRDVAGFLGKLFDQDHLGKSIDSILRLLSALGLGVYEMADSAVEGEGLQKLFDGLLVSLEPLIAAINTFVDILTGGIIEGLENGKEAGTFAGIWQTICDIFSLLGKIVSKVGAPVLNFVSSVLEIINELFDGELTGEKLKKLGKKLETAITKLFDDIFALIPGIGGGLQEFLAYIFGFAEDGAQDGADESSKTILGVAKKWLRKIFGGFANLFDNIKKDANQFNLFTWAKDMLGIGSFGKFLADMSGVVKGTNLYGLIMSFLGGYALFKLIGVLRKGGGLLNNLRGFFQGAKDAMQDGLKLKFGDKLESTGDKVMKIAIGIALIAGSVAILGSMSVDSLLKGFAALAGVMVALGGFLWIMKQFVLKDWKDAISLTTTIASIAAAILSITLGIGLLALMLKPLANMSMEGIIKMLTGLLGIVTILGLFVTYVGKDMKNLKGTRSIAALALAVGLLILALKPLANMDIMGILKMGGGLVGILYILTEFTTKVKDMSIKGVGGLILLATSIGILILSLLNLKDLKFEQLLAMGVSLFLILEMLTRFTKKVSFIKGAGMGQMVLIAGSIWVLMQALMPLAKLEWGDLAKIGAGLAATMLVIGMFINNTQSMHGTGMGNILMIAASIWVLMQALLPLANLEWPNLAKMGAGLLAVSIIVVLMTHLVDDMNVLQGAGIAIMMAGLAAVLLTFGFAMASLTGLSWEQISVACAYLIGILTSFGIIQKTLLKDNDILDAVHSLILMAGLAAVMLAFSIALNEIRNVPTDKIIAFSAGLAALIGAVGIALNLTKGMTLIGALKGILILSAAIAALMVVFALVGSFAMDKIGSSLTLLSAHLATFSGLIADFSTGMASVDEGGIEKAKRVVTLLVDLLWNIAGISVGAESSRALTEMSANLSLFSGMISDFSNEIKGADEEGIAKAKRIVADLVLVLEDIYGITAGTEAATQLTQMSSNLMLTSGMLVYFSDRMINVNEESFKKARRIIAYVKAMMAGLNGFDSFTAQREAFTTAMFDLGTGVEIFDQHTGNVGDLSNNSALQLIKDLSGCAGDLDTIAKMNLDDLTSKLTGLGGAMMLYAKGAEEATGLDVNAEGAPNVEGAVKLLRDISNSLTENGGFTIPENMPSKEDLGLFGAQLAALAGALIEFEKAGSELGTGTEQALATLDFFKQLKDKLVEIDMGQAIGTALTSFITGQDVQIQPNEMETFGKNIEQLGLALSAFAKSTTVVDEATGEIKPVDYTKATEALESFSGLANSLPTIGGIHGWWEGNKESLTELAGDITALGGGLKDFCMQVTGQTDENYKGFTDAEIEEGKTASTNIVDKAVEIFTKITEAQGKLQNVGGITSIWEGDPLDFYTLAGQLAALGDGLKKFSMKITGQEGGDYKGFGVTEVAEIEEGKTQSTSVVDKAVEVFAKITEAQGKLKDVGGLKSVWTGSPPKLTDIGAQLAGLGQQLRIFSDKINGTKEGENAFDPTSTTAALGTVDSMISVMQQVSSKLPKVGGLGTVISTIFSGRQTELGDIGKQLGGLGEGLSSFATQIAGKFTNMDEAKNALDVVNSVITMVSTLAGAYKNMNYGDIGQFVGYLNEFLLGITYTDDVINETTGNNSIVDQIVSLMGSISEAVSKAGNIDKSNVDVFTTFTQALTNLAAINLANVNEMFKPVGENISAGVAAGINAGTSGVIDAAVAMAVSAYEAAKIALDEHSPSRIFMGLGRFTSEGFAIGIKQSSGLAESAGESMANSTVESTRGILASLSSTLLEDIDTQPTIRPVLDLSNVTAGESTLNSMFGRSYGVGLNTVGVSARASRTFTPSVVSDIQNGTDAESMMSRMDAMLENIQKMGDGISNMKLVLDTGVLAGGVADDVDVDIGRKMFYAERRN